MLTQELKDCLVWRFNADLDCPEVCEKRKNLGESRGVDACHVESKHSRCSQTRWVVFHYRRKAGEPVPRKLFVILAVWTMIHVTVIGRTDDIVDLSRRHCCDAPANAA